MLYAVCCILVCIRNIAVSQKRRPVVPTCVVRVVKVELDAVRFTFKLIVSGVIELVRVQQRHAVSSTHQIHQLCMCNHA